MSAHLIDTTWLSAPFVTSQVTSPKFSKMKDLQHKSNFNIHPRIKQQTHKTLTQQQHPAEAKEWANN
jgi:hypothetical protein